MALHVLAKLQLPSCVLLLILCCCPMTESDTISSCLRLRSYLEKPPFSLNLTDRAVFYIPDLSPPGAFSLVDEINVSFNVSIYQKVSKAKSSVALAIHLDATKDPSTRDPLCNRSQPDINLPKRSYPAAASNVSAKITQTVDYTQLILVQIDLEDSPQASSVVNTYAVTIHKILDGTMSVNVRGDGMPNPVSYTYQFIYSSIDLPQSLSMGFFSSIGLLPSLDHWNVESNRTTIYRGPFPGDYSRRLNLVVILSSVLGSAAAIAITTAAVYLYFNSKYRRWKKEQDKLAKIMQDLPGVPTKVDFIDIKKVTKNFHDTMKVGKGGFGAVYRCILPASASRTGQAMEVAVKKFTQEVEDRRFDDFLAEVSIINRLRHKNIVPLVRWSYNKGLPVLVYEYMPNGSLDHHLFQRGGHDRHGPRDARVCQWDTRYNIVRDIATGLHYVHHDHEPMVLHRDIKASNIMLDSTFRSRLGDFGIACTVAANKSSVTGFAGTPGYIGPDYAMSRKATRQTDIYAFGVLVLEVVTGKKNADVQPDDDHITDWVWRLHRQGMLLQAVDSILTAGDTQNNVILNDEAGCLLLLGLACTNPNPSNRPAMVEVVQIINKLVPTPEVPLERPTFVWPPEDWRTRNSIYSTAMSGWESSSTNRMELALLSQDLPTSASTGEQASPNTMERGVLLRSILQHPTR